MIFPFSHPAIYNNMDIKFTIGALGLFTAWIVVAFLLAQRRLNNAYVKFDREEDL